MDDNAQDHFQTPCPMIKLQSSDGEIFEVEVKVAKMSSYIKNMLDDLGVEENEVIPIPQNAPEISEAILKKIIQWANHHKNDPVPADGDDKQVKPTDDMSSWDAEFLRVDQSTLFELIRAVDYLNINGLLDVACKKVAQMTKGKTPEEVRRTFHIQNDFSPDEEEQVRKENVWFEGSCAGDNDHEYSRVVGEIPASAVKDEDNESSHVIESSSLKISVVVRKIFQHFSDCELLKLSFVNKTWNYEARSLMKKRGNLFGLIKFTDEEPCQEHVEDFLATTQQMNVVPFSGINIQIHHSRRHACLTQIPDRFRDISLEKFKVKKVFIATSQVNGSCPGLLLAKKVLLDFSDVLEDLSFQMDAKEKTFLSDVVQECRFPQLKVLKVEKFTRNGGQSSATDMHTVKKLVSYAPRLQELRTGRPMGSVLNALEGSPANFVYTRCVVAPYDDVIEEAIGALRVENISVYYTSPFFDFERFSRINPVLLHDSCTTLRFMEISAVLAVPLMSYGVVLQNVTDFDMLMNYSYLEWMQPRILRFLKDLNFTRIFPNLNKVRVYAGAYNGCHHEHMDRIIERANAVLPLTNPPPDRAANIKELDIDDSNLSNASARFFAQIFPNIKSLALRRREKREIPFGLIWKHWEDLVELKLSGRLGQNSDNFDSVFCGIFPEEVAELRQKDDEYLKRVNIVPVMPAITCLKNLRILTLKHDGQDSIRDGIFVDDGTFMFSKVTALIAFARCPALAASIIFTSYETPPDMSYLEPYVSVKSTKMLASRLP